MDEDKNSSNMATTNSTTNSNTNVTQSSRKTTVVCHGCQKEFPSRNAVFTHLKKTAGACLSGEAYADFRARVPVPDERVILLYGYRLAAGVLTTGNEAAEFLLHACLQVSLSSGGAAKTKQSNVGPNNGTTPKYLRSYGNLARKTNNDMVAQDDGTAGALMEVLASRLPPIGGRSMDDWIRLVNKTLSENLAQLISQRQELENTTPQHPVVEPRVVLFGRRPMPGSQFNCEMDVTHRKIDYVLPAQLLGIPKEKLQELLPPCRKERNNQQQHEPTVHMIDPTHPDERNVSVKLSKATLEYAKSLKRSMQQFTTHIVPLDTQDAVAVQAKQEHIRKLHKSKNKHHSSENNEITASEISSENHAKDENDKKSSTTLAGNVLKRKSFHNFTPTVMAHEYLANRRLDRFFYKATLHSDKNIYLLLSLTGDLFLKGQVCRVVGAWLGVQRGLIDEEIVDCLYDSDYPSLVPTPPAPPQGMYAQSAHYLAWEGKAQAILTPRNSDRYPNGWKDPPLLKAVHDFGEDLRESIVQEWENSKDTCDVWVRDVLEPWACKARDHLQQYRAWKASQTAVDTNVKTDQVQATPRPSSVDSSGKTAPEIYQAVLHQLRQVYETGMWPDTSTKRQVVMVTDISKDSELGSDASPVKPNASGSFSVGYMPRWQPKANALFPQLVKAAFALEQALLPDREPSSTIAVNRNAQFRPHVDSGAGAGQSTSLIVGLGDYTGGGLVVEGKEYDIRYHPMEFNGWTQRHWTLPFEGERFSLVWFTPKECQGMHGIDLEL